MIAEEPALGFAGLLRQLRAGAKLTQEELAEAAGLSPRSVSDLERGVNRTARKDTAELLAGALGLAGPVRALFVAAARGRAPADEVLAALRGETVAPADRGPGRQALELSPARFEFDTNRLLRVLFRVEPRHGEHAADGQTPFVGRERLRGSFRALIERARRGQGAVAMITGEAGVGKTRLVAEVGAEARQRGFGVFTGHCYDNPGDLPYMPWVEIVETFARRLGPGPARELMGDNAPALAQMVPELRRLCGEIDEPVTLPADQQRWFLFTSVREVLTTAANISPFVLVFEDLQWADESTLSLFEHFADWVQTLPALVIGTTRDQVAWEPTRLGTMLARLTRAPAAQFVPLERHSVDEVAELVEAMTGHTPPAQVTATLHAESDGNAFFVEELVRHLGETGRLFDERGNLRADVDDADVDVDVPHSVKLVTRERLLRLSPRAREVVGVAAVLGRRFRFELLEELVLGEDGDLLDAVEEAERAQFLVEQRDGSYRFSHELIRHTLLAELSTTRRRRVHVRIANALERRFPGDSAHASDIAEHLLASELTGPRTARHLVRAGDRAREGAAYEEALHHYERAAALLDGPEQAELLLKLGTALRGVGRWDEASATWERALTILEERGRDEEIVAVSYDLCQQLAWAYRFPEMAAVAERARAAIGDRESPERPRILGLVGVALALTGQPERADEHAAEARRLADASGDPQMLADVGLSETYHHYFFMRLHRTVEVGRPATEALRAAGSLWNLAETLAFLDVGLVFQGRFAESAVVHRELDPLAERLRHGGASSTAMRNRFASAAAQRADLEELTRIADLQLQSANMTHNAGWVAFSHTLRGILDFWRGDWERARASLQAGADTAGPFWAPAQRGWLLVLDAWEGRTEAMERGFAELEPLLPRPGRANLIGAWTLAALAAEAVGLTGGRKRAARLHGLVVEALATGTLMRHFDGRLLQTVAGMSAAAAGRIDLARGHFDRALEQAERIPHRLERPHAAHAYARVLLEHEPERAYELACYAERDYAAIGMARHAEAARDLASVQRG